MTVSASLKVDVPTIIVPEVDQRAITRWIEGRLNDARNEFIRQMSRGGGGRTYTRGRRFHRASAPGEYPVTDGGRLANSVDYQMVNALEGELHSDIDYAEYLTQGTKYMAKRKMLDDALKFVLETRPRLDVLAKAVRFRQRNRK